MIGDYRGFGMDDERSSKHGESPWVCPTCGCPRSASKRLEQKKPRVSIDEVQRGLDYIRTYPSYKRLEFWLKEIGVEVEE